MALIHNDCCLTNRIGEILMARNSAVDAVTGLGLIGSVVAAPFTGGLSLLGIPALGVARLVRHHRDENEEFSERDKGDLAMDTQFPIVTRRPWNDDLCHYPFSGIQPIDHRSVLADRAPRRLLSIMREENSADLIRSTMESLAPSCYEMVRQKPTSHIRGNVRIHRTFLGGIKKISFNISTR